METRRNVKFQANNVVMIEGTIDIGKEEGLKL